MEINIKKISVLMIGIVLIGGCTSTDKKKTNSMDEICNIQGEWADESGALSLIFKDSTVELLDFNDITYTKLNDSVLKVIYPNRVAIVDVKIGESLSDDLLIEYDMERGQYDGYIMAKGGMLGNSFDVKNNVLIFGADRLKTTIIGDSKVKISFPQESYWTIKCIEDPPTLFERFGYPILMIYSGKDTTYYGSYYE
ncbi:hypothetical protein OAJ52_00965 [Bacteroidia bacterium]|jgi:hypothetical protein|nr:hypothetical protein [Bacteroidia bacterium]|tara:strand:+ start:99 stop:686 length:588 start_codon:yes stop_codon:yes gene_type:complete